MYTPGESVKKTYTITNLATAIPVDLSVVDDIIVHLKTTDQNVIKKLSLNTKSGYDTLPPDGDDDTGKVQVVLNSSETLNLSSRDVFIEFKIHQTDIDYTDGNGGIAIDDVLFARFGKKKSTTDVSL